MNDNFIKINNYWFNRQAINYLFPYCKPGEVTEYAALKIAGDMSLIYTEALFADVSKALGIAK